MERAKGFGQKIIDFVELVLDLLGQGIVKVVGHHEVALGEAEKALSTPGCELGFALHFVRSSVPEACFAGTMSCLT